MMQYTLHHGDCLDVMRTMPDSSIDAIVTDPPYELGFMGKHWDASGIAFKIEVWREALRVLKPGGHLLAFSGSRTYHRMAVAIEDAGFEVRDQIMWIYGSGFPKSLNLKDEWQGWGTALKPAHEPIVVARKPLIGTVAANVITHGVGALNIDGCRVGDGGQLKWSTPRDMGYHGGTVSTAEATENAQGRWPANVIHDGSDEVVELFPYSKTNCIETTPTTSSGEGWGSIGSNRGPRGFSDEGSAARFFYCAKASKRDRNEGLDGFADKTPGEMTDRTDGSAGLNNPRAGAGRTGGGKNHHPTVKPTELMRYLIRLVTPRGATVLDPFMGSGSTGKAAMYEGVRFIGIEQDADYIAIAEARIQLAVARGDGEQA